MSRMKWSLGFNAGNGGHEIQKIYCLFAKVKINFAPSHYF